MESVLDTQIKIGKRVLILNLIIGGISYFIFDSWLFFVAGLAFGTFIALLNFRLLYLTLAKAVHMSPSKAQIYAASRYIVRFTITGIVLFISIKADYINVLGTIFGLVSLKIIILTTELFNNLQFFKNIINRKEVK